MNNNEEIFTCRYCGKVCKNKMSKVKHEWLCKKNPDYNKHLEIQRNTVLKARFTKERVELDRKRCIARRQKFLEDNPDEAYQDFVLTCKKCGEKFIRNLKIRHFKNNYRVPQFCCTEHAHSRVHTEESKNKVSESVKKEHLHKCPKCGKEFMHRGTATNQTFCDDCYVKYYNCSKTNKANKRFYGRTKIGNDVPLHESKCPSCGKSIWSKTSDDVYCYECCESLNKRVHQLFSPMGKRIYSAKTKEILKNAMRKLVKSGKHKGWQSRNIKSYPEIFWEKVLNNNGISFIREKRVNGYFLDFVLRKGDKEIDLEIDGKQHKYEDRKIHDKKRDKNLRETGYIVYRIDWNEINSKRGSLKMKAKIRQFLWWLEHQ